MIAALVSTLCTCAFVSAWIYFYNPPAWAIWPVGWWLFITFWKEME